ncbi:MAG: T9SS type A sorting domain-containing protein [Bacteroidota bacterium]
MVPLVSLEKGTTFFVAQGRWDSKSDILQQDSFIEVEVRDRIAAGTILSVMGDLTTEGLSTKGKLLLEEGSNHIFIYQKDTDEQRFVYALGWGHPDVWNARKKQGSGIPFSLSEENHTLVKLGSLNNYQYFVRNGASGTRSMLRAYLAKEVHWKGEEETVFTPFRTRLNILNAPVILFHESVSSLAENEQVITLKVAIHEHDGSKLEVGVRFDSLLSTSNQADFDSTIAETINFTGIIGDAVQMIRIPLADDNQYEGRETAYFRLHNLTKGSFGDFMGHTAFISDDEIPSVAITKIHAELSNTPAYIELINLESIGIDLKGWEVRLGKQKAVISGSHVIPAEATSRFYIVDELPGTDIQNAYALGSKALNMKKSDGTVSLYDHHGRFVFDTPFRQRDIVREPGELMTEVQPLSSQNQGRTELSAPALSSSQAADQRITSLEEGWYSRSELSDFIRSLEVQKQGFSWNEQRRNFESDVTGQAQLFLFESPVSLEGDTLSRDEIRDPEQPEERSLTIKVSATDVNEDGTINDREGFNLVHLAYPGRVHVEQFVAQLSDLIEITPERIHIYAFDKVNPARFNSRYLERRDVIESGSWVWIHIKEPLEPVVINFTLEEGYNEAGLAEEEIEMPDSFKLILETDTGTDEIEFYIRQPEDSLFEVNQQADINAYHALHPFNERSVHLAAIHTSSPLSDVGLNADLGTTMEVPIQFWSTDDGDASFSIVGWDYIPTEWQLFLVHTETGEEFELFELESVDIPFLNSYADPQTQEAGLLTSGIQVHTQFALRIVPPVTEELNNELPEELELYQNYPNPFNPVTTISFYLPETQEVRLSVFNVVGQPIAVLMQGVMNSGEHQIDWDASDKPSGMYIYQLEVGNKIMTRKMTLVK